MLVSEPVMSQCYSVSQLNAQTRALLESHYGKIWVEGEISNFKAHSSGHWYFSLKDQKSQVRCAMFRYANQSVSCTVSDGLFVRVLATVSLYEGRGDYQLIAEAIEPVGDGALQLAFDKLKKKLHAEGLFDERHKKKLIDCYHHIAVITSPTGAAIQDVLTTLKQRSIGQTISLYCCDVQGKVAVQAIRTMLAKAIAVKPDVIILVRGGGSLEDLWCFNDEMLARDIHAAVIPVVSGVGHEIDFTICDFVSDHRAATPTAAAISVSPDPVALKKLLEQQQQRLSHNVLSYFNKIHYQISLLENRLNSFLMSLTQKQQRIDYMHSQLIRGLTKNLAAHRVRYEQFQKRLHPRLINIDANRIEVNHAAERLTASLIRLFKLKQESLYHLAQRLEQAAPQTILNKGYAIIYDEQDRVVTDSAKIESEHSIKIQFAAGSAEAQVKKVHTLKS